MLFHFNENMLSMTSGMNGGDVIKIDDTQADVRNESG